MQDEWDRVEQSKQPVLEIQPFQQSHEETGNNKVVKDNVRSRATFSLPWSEEESKTDRRGVGGGYDGELTQMTFKHVINSDVFESDKASDNYRFN